ncbi:hypothetical protein OHB05_03245 [Streptomyces sp. NBC_00638]|uniref:Rv1733c family protein n=1 Tax=unclassified Streptomyces TaxID=2593676 RepID=UPI00224DDE94|nr:hypothetical protein [Streptomyces sp. NBC_00638]MCX5001647.1 hypothetical protein [Streptomyces sp. NBC_00638]
MRGAQGARQWCWRWRRNPLRRRDDVFEAWIVLIVWMVMVLGGTVAGLVTAHAADASFTRLRHDRHAIPAVLVESSGAAVPAGEGAVYDQVRAKVRWTAPDGSVHTGRALVESGHKAGAHVVIWMDMKGRLVGAPPSAGAATAEASLLGIGAAVSLGGLVFGAGSLARWRLDQRRYDRWAREWERLGPQWGHKTP